jgi:hypothetical protein
MRQDQLQRASEMRRAAIEAAIARANAGMSDLLGGDDASPAPPLYAASPESNHHNGGHDLLFNPDAASDEHRVSPMSTAANSPSFAGATAAAIPQPAFDLDTTAAAAAGNGIGPAAAPGFTYPGASSAGGITGDFSLSEFYLRANVATRNELDKLKAENAQLRARVEAFSGDYQMVQEMRRAYREMETQRLVIESTIRTATEENNALRGKANMMAASQGGLAAADGSGGISFTGTSSGGDASFLAAAGAAMQQPKKRPPWRSNTFS